MSYVLSTQGLSKRYGRFQALDGLSMHVEKGAIYGLVGRNGAGKTTLIRLICGLQRPTSGGYTLYGASSAETGVLAARRRMGAVVETPSIYLHLSAEENLREQYRVLGRPSFDGISELLDLVELKDAGKKRAGHFSLGMRQRLGIAVALAGDPDFLVLDEPVNGLDPQGIVEMRELILKLNRQRQITILISSHILDELARLATHYGFLDGGRMVGELSAAELEAACRKCTLVEVTDLAVLLRVLDRLGTEYSVVSDQGAELFGEVAVTPLVLALAEEQCQVLRLTQRDETLESYFINLVGGARHA